VGRLIRGVFDPGVKFEFVEGAPGEVDGEHILGKVRGRFFVPGGVSRNSRYYPPEVWERQLGLEEVKSRLENKQMFGTIGHEDEISDKNLRDGKMSHIVTRLTPDGQNCEALILNTPAGKVLNTVLRAGAKLYVSSRADGEYKGTHNGVPMVDPEKFKLEGFDFVLDPGFLEANPGLVESYKADFDSVLGGDAIPKRNFTEKEVVKSMEQEFAEALMKKNSRLEEELNRVLGELQMQTSRANSLEAERSVWSQKERDLTETKKALESAQASLKEYESLGTPSEISRAFDLAMKMKESFKELGTPKEISRAFDLAAKRLREYKSLGSVSEIRKALDLARKLLEAYKPLGRPGEIKAAFDKAEGFIRRVRETQKKKKVEALSKELGVPEKDITKVLGKPVKEEDIKDLVKSLRESTKAKDRFGARPKDKDSGGSDNESRGVDFSESLADRLSRQFNRTVPTSKKKVSPINS